LHKVAAKQRKKISLNWNPSEMANGSRGRWLKYGKKKKREIQRGVHVFHGKKVHRRSEEVRKKRSAAGNSK